MRLPAAYTYNRIRAFVRDDFQCRICARRRKPKNLTAHHIVERSKGGGHHLDNLLTACQDCHHKINKVKNGAELVRFSLELQQVELARLVFELRFRGGRA